MNRYTSGLLLVILVIEVLAWSFRAIRIADVNRWSEQVEGRVDALEHKADYLTELIGECKAHLEKADCASY